MNLKIVKIDVLVSWSFSFLLCLFPSLLQDLEKKVCVEVFSIIKGFTIVMSFCLASETVEARLLLQVLGLGAVVFGNNCVYSKLDFHRSLVSGLRFAPRRDFGEERGLLSRTAPGNQAHVCSCLMESVG